MDDQFHYVVHQRQSLNLGLGSAVHEAAGFPPDKATGRVPCVSNALTYNADRYDHHRHGGLVAKASAS